MLPVTLPTHTLNCPNCGAPAHVTPGQPPATCTFCNQSFPVPGVAPPVQQPAVIRQIIVMPPEPVARQMAQAVAVSRGFNFLFALIPVVVIAMGTGISFLTMRRAESTLLGATGGLSITDPFAKDWPAGEPLVCNGNDHVEVTGFTGTFTSGPAISAGGNCHVKCKGCRLKAPSGVEADGNAEIVLIDSSVEGSPVGITANGNADVKLLGTSTLVGKVVKTANGQVTAPPSIGTGMSGEDAGITHHAPPQHAQPAAQPTTTAKPATKPAGH